MQKFVFDTYALFEIIAGNPDYAKYLESEIIINDFIFAELCYKLIRENVENANFYIDKYKDFVMEVKAEIIKKAMKFRVDNKKKKMSGADCISYMMAQELGIRFLTGDKEFEKMSNVEFVK
ncbi:MAG: PIN domain-containing protein [Nanoarchaeota archaeon]